MFRLSRRCSTILVLLALALAGPWPAAEAAGRAGAVWLQPVDLAAQIWEAFVGLLNENGCSVDPSGACGAGSPAVSTVEEACSLDPDGRRACGPAGTATAASDEGCSLDPSGGCRR
jgi:hypothetical protein